MKQFGYNLIHMTQGELFVTYWYLWLGAVVVTLSAYIIVNKMEANK